VKTEFIEIAGLEGRPRFDTAPDAATVARAGYAAYRANTAIFIPGFFNKLGIFMERLVPRSVPRGAVRKLNAPQ
jgi:short-subunit dehydrogenase